jgi:hypothetical protein
MDSPHENRGPANCAACGAAHFDDELVDDGADRVCKACRDDSLAAFAKEKDIESRTCCGIKCSKVVERADMLVDAADSGEFLCAECEQSRQEKQHELQTEEFYG